MQLMTKEIEQKLPPLYATEKMPTDDKPIIVKFFTPDSSWTWYVVEGEKTDDGDYMFFGLVDGFEREWGYFQLSELANARGPMGLPIERDMYFDNKTIKDIPAR